MITSLTRALTGHWSTTETTGAWLADILLDLSAFTPGGLTVTFTADVVVQAGSQGIFVLGAGGNPQELGSSGAAATSKNGPYTGSITAPNSIGITATAGPDILHLIAESADGQPVEISNVVIAIRDTR